MSTDSCLVFIQPSVRMSLSLEDQIFNIVFALIGMLLLFIVVQCPRDS
jgi:hypothetical protein